MIEITYDDQIQVFNFGEIIYGVPNSLLLAILESQSIHSQFARTVGILRYMPLYLPRWGAISITGPLHAETRIGVLRKNSSYPDRGPNKRKKKIIS
jgi:hypothetical protein